MMLPGCCDFIFNKYDTLGCLEGKTPMMKLMKLCLPRDKGGLPDTRLYYISFEMEKLDLHWPGQYNLDWAVIETLYSFLLHP